MSMSISAAVARQASVGIGQGGDGGYCFTLRPKTASRSDLPPPAQTGQAKHGRRPRPRGYKSCAPLAVATKQCLMIGVLGALLLLGTSCPRMPSPAPQCTVD